MEVGGGWGTETRHGEDLWELNNSFHKMRVSWDGGEEIVTFIRSQDRAKKKRVDIGTKTSKLRFTAESVARGKHDDLMLDDVLIHGVMGR